MPHQREMSPEEYKKHLAEFEKSQIGLTDEFINILNKATRKAGKVKPEKPRIYKDK